MKRKILSLALALMMILSVAAALPVSADGTDTYFLEPRAGSLSNGNYLFRNDNTAPTYDGMTWGDGEGDSLRLYYGQTSFKYYAYSTLEVTKAGFYDVYIAAGTKTGAKAKFETDSLSVEGDLQSTETAYTVKENNIGYIYLPAGETINYKLWLTSGTGSGNDTYVFDIELRYKEVQPTGYTITATAGEGGRVTGSAVIEAGKGTKLLATPNDGYVFEGWYLNGEKVGSELLYTVSDVQADATYTAMFEEGIVVELEDYISGATVGTVAGASGGKMVYTAWGGVQTKPTIETITVNIPKTGLYNIDYVVNAKTTYGSLTTFYLDGEEFANNTGTAIQTMTYKGNSTLNSYAALKKYRVEKFLEAGEYSITMDLGLAVSNGSVAPDVYKFQYDYISFVCTGAAYTITANATEGGTATGAAALSGESATITATANAGYIFDGWYNASDVKVSSNASYTIEDVQADAAYTAKFKAGMFIEPREATKSNGNYLFNHGNAPTYEDGMTWGDGETDSIRYYYTIKSFGYYLSGTLTAGKTGYYDVMIAAATTTGASAKLEIVDSNSVSGSLQATSSTSSVKENNIGKIYLTAGEAADYKLYATAGGASGQDTYIYDVMLAYSNDQSVPNVMLAPNTGTIVEQEGADHVFSLSAAPTYEGMTWGDGAADGRYFWNGQTSGLDYTITTLASAAGYYDVYVAAGNAATATATVTVGDNSVTKALTVTGARTTAMETNLGKIYIPAGEATFAIRFTVGSDKLNVYDIMLKRSDDQTEPPPSAVVLDLASASRPNGIGGGPWTATQADPYSWIVGSEFLVNGEVGQSLVFESVTLPKDGWYDIYFGARSYGNYVSAEFRMNILDGETALASDVAVGDVSAYTATNAKSAMVASVYLTKGSHKITVAATNSVVALVGMKFEYTGADKTASSITFTDVNGKAVTSVAGGEDIFAEIATTAADGKIFIAQYTGTGADKKLVATSYATAAKSHGQASGKNVYRTQLKTAANVGEVKAFLWTTDGNYIPLAATATASVN